MPPTPAPPCSNATFEACDAGLPLQADAASAFLQDALQVGITSPRLKGLQAAAAACSARAARLPQPPPAPHADSMHDAPPATPLQEFPTCDGAETDVMLGSGCSFDRLTEVVTSGSCPQDCTNFVLGAHDGRERRMLAAEAHAEWQSCWQAAGCTRGRAGSRGLGFTCPWASPPTCLPRIPAGMGKDCFVDFVMQGVRSLESLNPSAQAAARDVL